MKKNAIFSIFALISSAILFLNSSSGPALGQDSGYTGAPGDRSGTCQGCHNGGSFNPSARLELLNEAGTASATKYEAGKIYTIRLNISASGTPKGYGFQMIDIKKSDNANVKGFLPTAQQAANIGIDATSAGRIYAEHNSILSTKVIDVKWKAPAITTGIVTFYAVGNAVNGANGSGGDNGTSSTNIEFSPLLSSTNELVAKVTMNVSPNPTTEGVTISVNSQENKNLQVRVSDITGRTVLTQNWSISAGENQRKLDVNQLAKGAYMIQLSENQDFICKKIIKL